MRFFLRTKLSGSVVGLLGVVIVAVGAHSQGGPLPKNSEAPAIYSAEEGQGVLTLNLSRMADFGLALSDPDGVFEGASTAELALSLLGGSDLDIVAIDRTFGSVVGGSAVLSGGFEFTGPNGDRHALGNFLWRPDEGSFGSAWTLVSSGVEAFRLYTTSLVELDLANERMILDSLEVSLASDLAERLGTESSAGAILGSFHFEASVSSAGRRANSLTLEGHPQADEHGSLGGVGPDVIVGDLPDQRNWGVSNNIRAYSLGTTSCNIGDQELDWMANINRHPVIGQSMYRYENGRFVQLGQSWLKHGFFALSGTLCSNDCQGTDGSRLGINCSDPYGAGLNGGRSGLGPKSEVNAATGAYPYPPTRPTSVNSRNGRIQVHVDDIDANLHPSARYFVEGHYVTPDDAAAGNATNNASYREVSLSASNRSILFNRGQTVRQFSAIFAWPTIESGVLGDKQEVAGDGRFNIMSKATDLGGGIWHYEFAVANLNSHRSGQSFSVPLPTGANVTNIGFRDVDYHSGEPYSGTAWTANPVPGDSMTWSTQTFAQNQNANALRWGTLYNFWFDCDCPPEVGTGTMGLFRPGTPDVLSVNVRVPSGDPPGDIPDLAINDLQVDFDPSDSDIDAGPGAIGQAVDVVMTVRNSGNVAVVSADLSLSADVFGGALNQKNLVVTDFSSAPGVQSLAPGTTADILFSFAAGELDRCGTYNLVGTHEPANLESIGIGGAIFGDTNLTNDSLSSNDLELAFGTIEASVVASSVIIEDFLTEKVKIDIDYEGLGAGGDSHDVGLSVDLTDLGGVVQYLSAFSVSRTGVASSGMKMLRIRIDLSGLFPSPSPGSEFRVRLRLRDTNSSEVCIEAQTPNSFTVQ